MCKANMAVRRKFHLDSSLTDKMLGECELIHEEPKEPDRKLFFAPAECFNLGICVCGTRERQDIKHFFENISRIFRRTFWKKKKVPSKERALLDGFNIYLEFQVSVKQSLAIQGSDSGLASALDANDDAWDDLFMSEVQNATSLPIGPGECSRSRFFFHIGYINLSTFHFGVLEMDRCETYQTTQPAESESGASIHVLSAFPFEDAGVLMCFPELFLPPF